MNTLVQPSLQTLVKLGSIVVHADELTSPGGHEFDKQAIRALMQDEDVQAWIKGMSELALLPRKRDA
jgi:vacuolar-type H+-ATPase subunit C/Vma6